MRRHDWLLMLLAVSDSSEPLDPVRLQKGMFLLSRERQLPAAEAYDFSAYDYGPFSVDIYRDLDALFDAGLVERIPAPGYSWSRYRATERGTERAQSLVDHMGEEQRERALYLQEMKRGVLGLSFKALLNYVYGLYPEYSENSIFNG